MKLLRVFPVVATVAFGLVAFLSPRVAMAVGGTHANPVSTFDTTRSTVVFSYQHGFLLEGGYMNMAGYNANFTSTTGRLSAQFGLHYVGLKPETLQYGLHGISGSAVAVYGIPIGKRYANGMPKAAFTLFGGSVPTAIFNGEYNFFSIPINLGLGIEVNPVKWISIVPWFELAPSFNLDTRIRYDAFEQYLQGVTEQDINIVYNPDGTIQSVTAQPYVVDNVLQEAVDLEFSFAMRMRGGLNLVLNLGDKLDLQFTGSVAQVGSAFDAKPTVFVGGAFVFAWDDAPEKILPEEDRLKRMSCDKVSARFTSCAAYQQLVEQIRTEERARLEAEAAQAEPPPPPTPEPVVDEEEVAPPPIPDGNRPLSPTGVGTAASAAPAAPAVRPDTPPQPVAPAEDAPPSLSEPLTR